MSHRGSYLNYDFSTKDSKLDESCRYPTILVEGKNDEIVYSKISGEKCIIRCDGKDDVIKKLTDFPRDNKIAIVDVDYDDKLEINNLFYTDYNDLECMAVNLISKEDFCKYLNVDKSDEDRFIKRIYEPVLNNVKELSNLWEFCYNNNSEYLVSKYDKKHNILFNKIINLEKNKINYNEISNIYLSIGRDLFINNNIINIMKNNNSDNFRGHDFFLLLFFYIKRKDIKLNIDKLGNIDSKFIEEYFIEQSSKDQWIKKSKLYKDIKSKFNDIFE